MKRHKEIGRFIMIHMLTDEYHTYGTIYLFHDAMEIEI